MSEGSLQRLEQVLAEALECPSEDRGGFLDDACRDDPGLRREVEELLASRLPSSPAAHLSSDS